VSCIAIYNWSGRFPTTRDIESHCRYSPEPLQFAALSDAVLIKGDGLLAGFERSPAREFSFTVSLWILQEREDEHEPNNF
jgi:hypothetical protein